MVAMILETVNQYRSSSLKKVSKTKLYCSDSFKINIDCPHEVTDQSQ